MSKKNSSYIEILNCLRANVIKAGFIDKAYGTNISNALTRILDEYFKRNTPSLPELSTVLRLNKSTVSRGYLGLKKHKLVTFNTESKDKRRKILKLTTQGEDFLKLHNDFTFKQVKSQSKNLSKTELDKFIKYLEVFCGQKMPPELDHLEKIILTFRRLTDLHGVASGSYLGSGYSTSDWVILSEIQDKSPTSKDLMEILRMPQSTLSQKLSILSKSKLLKFKLTETDSRSKFIYLTDKGNQALSNIRNRAEEVFGKELSALNKVQTEEFVELLKKYTN